MHWSKSTAALWPVALWSVKSIIPKKKFQKILPKLSFSWWVLLGSLGPGTQGDSCFGTYCTPAAATRIMGESIGTETLKRMQNLGHFHFTLDPLFRETGEVATKWTEINSQPHTAVCTQSVNSTVYCPSYQLRVRAKSSGNSAEKASWVAWRLGYLGGLVLSPTHVAELAATTAPVFQLVLQGPLALL